MLTFMDNAAENSVAAQSLVTNCPGACPESHRWTSAVRRSRVNAATSKLVSRYGTSVTRFVAQPPQCLAGALRLSWHAVRQRLQE